MPRGGARPGAGRKPDPNSKAARKRARRAALEAAGGHAPSGQKTVAAPRGWPFGTQEPPAEVASEVVDPDLTPLDFALQVMRDPGQPMQTRLAAMAQALPYCHAKKGDEGKKAAKQAAAEAVQSKFSRAAPPRLVSNRG